MEMKKNIKKYTGVLLVSTVVIGGIASAAMTPIPTISNTFAVAGQVIKSTDLNKLAEALNILDTRDTALQEQINLQNGGVPTGQTPIEFKNKTYGTITVNGKVWLDRNIGASRQCTNANDELCFGDYVQWGRPLDDAKSYKSNTSATQLTTITPTGWPNYYDFIIGSSDWTTADSTGAERQTFLAKTDGTGVCPTGFYLPTETELTTLAITNASDAFTKLKLPVAGYRSSSTGAMDSIGSYANLWSSSPSGSLARRLSFNGSSSGWDDNYRATGFSLRCVQVED